MKKIFVGLSVIFFSLLFFINNANADTHTVTNCSLVNITAAITAASTGDIVSVPAGSCTWNSTLKITKGIKLIGAGIGNTIITGSGGSFMIGIDPANYSDITNLYRVSGFTFNQNNAAAGIEIGTYYKSFSANAPSLPKFRVDHNRFQNSNDVNLKAIEYRGTMNGVVDSNQFIDVNYPIRNDTAGSAASIATFYQYLWSYWDAGNSYSCVYEDNTFSGVYYDSGSAIVMDCQYGSRYVVRYNTISIDRTPQPAFDSHGYFGGDMVSCFGTEIYGNIITNNGSGWDGYTKLRGGKNMVFNNVGMPGSVGCQIYADMCPPTYVSQQLIHDSYFWGNRAGVTGSLMGLSVNKTVASCNGLSNIPTIGRDAFYDTSSPGVGCGTLASRPSACIKGQGYWATNQSCSNLTGMAGANPLTPISGALYKCVSTNTWIAFYTPYTYPHPLRDEVLPPNTAPAAPTGVKVV